MPFVISTQAIDVFSEIMAGEARLIITPASRGLCRSNSGTALRLERCK